MSENPLTVKFYNVLGAQSPVSRDESNPLLWIFVILIIGVVAFVVVRYWRRSARPSRYHHEEGMIRPSPSVGKPSAPHVDQPVDAEELDQIEVNHRGNGVAEARLTPPLKSTAKNTDTSLPKGISPNALPVTHTLSLGWEGSLELDKIFLQEGNDHHKYLVIARALEAIAPFMACAMQGGTQLRKDGTVLYGPAVVLDPALKLVHLKLLPDEPTITALANLFCAKKRSPELVDAMSILEMKTFPLGEVTLLPVRLKRGKVMRRDTLMIKAETFGPMQVTLLSSKAAFEAKKSPELSAS